MPGNMLGVHTSALFTLLILCLNSDDPDSPWKHGRLSHWERSVLEILYRVESTLQKTVGKSGLQLATAESNRISNKVSNKLSNSLQ